MYSIWDKLTHSLLHRNLWENGNGKKIFKIKLFYFFFFFSFPHSQIRMQMWKGKN